MPFFRYEALSLKGRKIHGRVDAANLRAAKRQLFERGIAAIEIALSHEKEKRVRLQKKEILIFTREIARLLEAGLPLFEALSALEEKYRGQKFHPLLLDLADQILSGSAFSSALARHPESFDLLYISMIGNAEKTGSLETALTELAELLHKQLKVKQQVVSAMLYPSLLMFFCGVVLSSLLFFVVPSLKELFEGRNLHPFTKIVFYASDFACKSKAALLLFFATLFTLLGLTAFLPAWKSKVTETLLKLPVIKPLFAKVALIRFCRAAATLLEGGLPLITALSQARSVMRHPLLEAFIAQGEIRISEGEPLSKTFSDHPLIPPLVPRMFAIAEESGKLPFTCKQIAQIYEEELEVTLSNFASLAQPIMLVVLGALVGFVLLAVLLPLTDVSSFTN